MIFITDAAPTRVAFRRPVNNAMTIGEVSSEWCWLAGVSAPSISTLRAELRSNPVIKTDESGGIKGVVSHRNAPTNVFCSS
jgi:hypothetical protein